MFTIASFVVNWRFRLFGWERYPIASSHMDEISSLLPEATESSNSFRSGNSNTLSNLSDEFITVPECSVSAQWNKLPMGKCKVPVGRSVKGFKLLACACKKWHVFEWICL